MTPAERAEARLTAELLSAARRTDLLSTGLTLLAIAALLFRFGWLPLSGLALLLGLFARYYGFRIALDRRLFDELADGRLALSDLDAALRSLSNGKKGSAPRSLGDRCRGARRLVARHAVVTLAQVAALSLAALPGYGFVAGAL